MIKYHPRKAQMRAHAVGCKPLVVSAKPFVLIPMPGMLISSSKSSFSFTISAICASTLLISCQIRYLPHNKGLH